MLVTLEEVKIYLGIDLADTSQDSLLSMLISSADSLAKSYCGRSFEVADYDVLLDGTGRDSLLLPEYPVQSVTVLEVDGMAISSFYIEPNGIIIVDSGRIPEGKRNVHVVYRAGYEPDAVPGDLKEAVFILVASRYTLARERSHNLSSRWVEDVKVDYREAEIPLEAKAILERYRQVK